MATNKPISVWSYKPWWCQPWSILLTGCLLIGSTWWLTHIIWLTILVALPVLIWMGFFLLLYPRLMQQSGLLAGESSQSSNQ
ncbi:DUF6737 family protein [Pantanalinema sp. GBBB05]|uniref:DUF6737 family protein n=1 Tax=Pantanalinema sp. GBBB05 TaxID=2604139 RepID=UPI001D2778A5|nr:hypothetical protein [Pantanalinema sp. GBBB05]